MCRNRRDKKHLLPVTRWGPEREGGGRRPVKTCSPDPPLEASRWACQLTAVPLDGARYCTKDRAPFQTHCMVSKHKALVQEKDANQLANPDKNHTNQDEGMKCAEERSSKRPMWETNDSIMEQKVTEA